MGGFLAVLRKDLRLELRTGDTVISLAVLSLLILLVLVLAFGPAGARGGELAAGAIWIALVFGGMLGASRMLMGEHDNECMAGLVMSPADPGVVFLAKLLADFLFITIAEAATMVMVVLFFNLDFGWKVAALAPVILLGMLGFAAVSTLLAAITSQTRAGDLLMPLLVVPLFVPALIAGVKASAAVLAGRALAESAIWLEILAAFDLLFVSAGYLLFEYVVTER